jgi:hypothetical protein
LYGQLGDGSIFDKTIPIQATGLCNEIGIEETNLHSSILTFPNPTNGTLQIKTLGSGYHISISNALGQSIMKTNIFQQESTLDLTHLEPGAYFLKFTSVNNKSITKKILIQ